MKPWKSPSSLEGLFVSCKLRPPWNHGRVYSHLFFIIFIFMDASKSNPELKVKQSGTKNNMR
jgi:hypothetical protein